MRVLVCRSPEEAEATGRRLAALGHEPVSAPVLAIVPLPVVLPPDPDALVMTSRHAAASLAAEDLDRVRHRPVFAVGAATAAALRGRGMTDVRIGTGDAAALADLVRLTLPPGRRLLYLAGRVRKTILPDALQAAGYAVTILDAYDARPTDRWPAEVIEALHAGRLDACLHFSRRSASLALAAAARDGVILPFTALRHACLSADVAAPLVEAGVPDLCVAPISLEDSLMQALSSKIP